MGYLPAAMRNYLVRLGWAHGDQEIFSTEEMLAAFDLGAIGRSPARFDFAKLENLNGHYIRQMPDADLLREVERTLPYIVDAPEQAKLTPELRSNLAHAMAALKDPALHDKFRRALPGLKERAKTLIELLDAATFIFAERPVAMDDKAQALLTDEARALLGALVDQLAAIEPWSAEATEQAVRALAESRGIKLGGVAQPLRAALTGRTTSPPIFDVLAVLGRGESLARMRDQLAR
jgi:glutamyl-tRNA synthetase